MVERTYVQQCVCAMGLFSLFFQIDKLNLPQDTLSGLSVYFFFRSEYKLFNRLVKNMIRKKKKKERKQS